jgi:hypothetical protein
MIDNLNEEVTTSISEEQLMLENEDIFVDSRSTSVHNKPSRCISFKLNIDYEIIDIITLVCYVVKQY